MMKGYCLAVNEKAPVAYWLKAMCEMNIFIFADNVNRVHHHDFDQEKMTKLGYSFLVFPSVMIVKKEAQVENIVQTIYRFEDICW